MDISLKICDKLGGWSSRDREMLKIMAEFHDIGKIGVGRAIISKPGKLTPAEYEEMKKHTVYGSNFLKKFSRVYGVHYGALYHHEHWDGSGYPFGTTGTSIPIEARIIGLADAYDAMSNDRCYRKKLSRPEIIRELNKGRGTQFDPQLVDILLSIIDEEDKKEQRAARSLIFIKENNRIHDIDGALEINDRHEITEAKNSAQAA